HSLERLWSVRCFKRAGQAGCRPSGPGLREHALMEQVTVSQLLQEARAGLERLDPGEVQAALSAGAILIDIRSETQRGCDGHVPGARFVPRNVLEWRLDPTSDHRHPEAARRDVLLVVMCDEGFQSSLAAATLSR